MCGAIPEHVISTARARRRAACEHSIAREGDVIPERSCDSSLRLTDQISNRCGWFRNDRPQVSCEGVRCDKADARQEQERTEE